MRVNYFITKNGVLKRKQNTVYFVRKNENGNLEKRILPIEKVYAIYSHGRLSFSSGVISYLAKKGVPIHFFGYYGNYEGSFYPRETLVSGELVIRQAEHYLNTDKRLVIAKEIIKGCADNILKNLQYYSRAGHELDNELSSIRLLAEKADHVCSINELLGTEGNVWSNYYSGMSKLLPEAFRMETRARRPPDNMINCLISFGNSMMYATVLTEIYNTQLHPAISYLHEPFERRFSLSLDLSELFKPLIVDRVIFNIVNRKIISEEHFEKKLSSCLLNDSGRRLFIEHYNEKLNTTIKHKTLNRHVSYRMLIRIECYKLIKHLIGVKNYESFRMWW